MQLKANTPLFFASLLPGERGSTNKTSLQGLYDAIKGGMSLSDVEIFTEHDEAKKRAERLAVEVVAKAAIDRLDPEQLGKLLDIARSPNLDKAHDLVTGLDDLS